jgi:hypothetical protein
MDIPLNGTLPRCQHGVYKPTNHKIAYGCGFCNPHHFDAVSENTNVPVFAKHRHRDVEVPRANKGYVCKSRCPKCDSDVHYESEVVGGPWECADCGHKFKGRAA